MTIVDTMVVMTGTQPSLPSSDETAGAPDPVDAAADPPAGNDRWERAAVLFGRWRDGDAGAMDDLVRLITPVLWQVARAYGLDRDLAEDVVQTTWLTLVRRHTSIAKSRAVVGWLTTCARREAWRVSKRQRRADPDRARAAGTTPAHGPLRGTGGRQGPHGPSALGGGRPARRAVSAIAARDRRSTTDPTTRASHGTWGCPWAASGRHASDV